MSTTTLKNKVKALLTLGSILSALTASSIYASLLNIKHNTQRLGATTKTTACLANTASPDYKKGMCFDDASGEKVPIGEDIKCTLVPGAHASAPFDKLCNGTLQPGGPVISGYDLYFEKSAGLPVYLKTFEVIVKVNNCKKSISLDQYNTNTPSAYTCTDGNFVQVK